MKNTGTGRRRSAALPRQTFSTLDLIQKVGLSQRGWTLLGHWTSDRWVLGFARQEDPVRRVYVSTEGQPPGRYQYECAGASEHESGEGLEIESLLAVLERHLGT
jgi:hypothetical protein